jgi:hypothetical protein
MASKTDILLYQHSDFSKHSNLAKRTFVPFIVAVL